MIAAEKSSLTLGIANASSSFTLTSRPKVRATDHTRASTTACSLTSRGLLDFVVLPLHMGGKPVSVQMSASEYRLYRAEWAGVWPAIGMH